MSSLLNEFSWRLPILFPRALALPLRSQVHGGDPVPLASAQAPFGWFMTLALAAGLVWVYVKWWRLQQKLARCEAELERVKAQVEVDQLAKKRFLAVMGHELRTPMNAILGFSELLHEEEMSHEASFYVSNITRSGRHLNDLFEQVLDYAKAEKGAIELVRSSFRLREAIDTLLNELQDNLQKKALEFDYAIDHDVPDDWWGDVGRLQQILRQALFNALKFTENGRISLHVSAITSHDGGAFDRIWLQFAVSDTGLGMEAAYLPEAFEAFSQEDSGVARRFGGMGLGLSLMKELTTLKGGTLHLDSEVGTGTRLTIRIPFKPTQKSWAERQE